MVLVFLNWIYIFWISLGMGLMAQTLVKKKSNLFFILLFGLFAEMLLVHIYALWFSVNEIFYGLSFIIASTGMFINKKFLSALFSTFISEWKSWKKTIQIFGFLLTILILMQSATKPFIVDN